MSHAREASSPESKPAAKVEAPRPKKTRRELLLEAGVPKSYHERFANLVWRCGQEDVPGTRTHILTWVKFDGTRFERGGRSSNNDLYPSDLGLAHERGVHYQQHGQDVYRVTMSTTRSRTGAAFWRELDRELAKKPAIYRRHFKTYMVTLYGSD
jgi:hypothetical protein